MLCNTRSLSTQVACSLVALSAKLIHRFNRKNTFCSYHRDSPCVGLREAVEPTNSSCTWGASPTHQMLMTVCPTMLWDRQKRYRIVRVYGAIQVLRNAIFLEIEPHPPPRNANNIEYYTFVTLLSRKSDPPTPICVS